MSKTAKKSQRKNFAEYYAAGYTLAFKFIFILFCPIAGGLGCGIWLDKRLGTTPWLMFVLMILSLAFAIYAVYRVAVNLQEELNKTGS